MADIIYKYGRWDIDIHSGSQFSESFTIYADSNKTTLATLTNYNGRAEVRDTTGGNLLLTLTVTIDSVNAVVTISATATQTAALTTNGVYDVLIYAAGQSTNPLSIISGNVRQHDPVTA